MMSDHNPTNSSSVMEKRCRDSDNSSASCVLTDDLLIEILSRVPSKSLLKFMCVSKSWRYLISNCLPLSPALGLLCSSETIPENVHKGYIPLSGGFPGNCWEAIDFYCANRRTPDHNLILEHYCNGLFLLSNPSKLPAAFHVCNPTTNECVALPEPPSNPFVEVKPTFSVLAFDPHESPHCKVVRFSFPDNCWERPRVDIFISEDRRWITANVMSEHDSIIYSLFYGRSNELVYLNGALYVIACPDSLYSFLVDDVQIRITKLPKRMNYHEYPCLGKSEGYLCYAGHSYDELYVWTLENFDTGEWVLKNSINVTYIDLHLLDILPLFHWNLFTFHPNLEVLFIQIEGKIFAYYFGSKRDHSELCQEVCTFEPSGYLDLLIPYSRCLTSLSDLQIK